MIAVPEFLFFVMPGQKREDPGIHRKKLLISDGLPGQARQ
jgi:hypothetical protein